MKSITLTLLAGLIFLSANAQDGKSTIHIKMEKDGKVIKDTTYTVDEDINTEIVTKILDMSFGVHPKEKHVMTFVSKDGEMHEMDGEHMNFSHEGEGNSHVFVTTEEGEDGETKVIVKKIITDKPEKMEWKSEENKVYIIKDGENEEVYEIKTGGEKPVWIDDKGNKVLIMDSEDGKTKTITLTSDGKNEQHFTTEDGKTIIVHSSGCDKEKEVKVEVIVEDQKQADSKKEKEVKSRKSKKDQD